ncbi:hypothetical protein G6F61_014338 [Rhizopus arrhizus]|nr:hypothetical protein G6F61_014338 [Rhizopus arrhizus]
MCWLAGAGAALRGQCDHRLSWRVGHVRGADGYWRLGLDLAAADPCDAEGAGAGIDAAGSGVRRAVVGRGLVVGPAEDLPEDLTRLIHARRGCSSRYWWPPEK